jgi:hypothetical protein
MPPAAQMMTLEVAVNIVQAAPVGELLTSAAGGTGVKTL